LVVTAALAGCGSEAGDNEANLSGPAREAVPTEAELARDADLANEAAADDAHDMGNFGGSAVEMDLRNRE
jgi:hypothetical protein